MLVVLLIVVLVVFLGALHMQVVFLVILYLASICGVCNLKPWRTYVANMSELSVLLGLIPGLFSWRFCSTFSELL